MKTTITTKTYLERLFSGRFEVMAEVTRDGRRLDIVKIERVRTTDINGNPNQKVVAYGRFNNHHGSLNLDGTTSFDDLLEHCKDEQATLVLDTDFAVQQALRALYAGDKAVSDNLEQED